MQYQPYPPQHPMSYMTASSTSAASASNPGIKLERVKTKKSWTERGHGRITAMGAGSHCQRYVFTNRGTWTRMLAWGRLQSNQTMKNTKCMYIYMYSSIWLGPRAGRETSLFNEVSCACALLHEIWIRCADG